MIYDHLRPELPRADSLGEPLLPSQHWQYDVVWEWNESLKTWLIAYANLSQQMGYPPDCPWEFYPMWKQSGPPYLVWQMYYLFPDDGKGWVFGETASNWPGGPKQKGACD